MEVNKGFVNLENMSDNIFSSDLQLERHCAYSINKVKSDWAPVLSVVPKWSALGPTLFVLYLNPQQL